MSSRTQQYIFSPPSIPEFMYARYETAWNELIGWAEKEYVARRTYLIKNRYYREFKVLNEEWSPVRILAEMTGFRRLCAKMSEELWKQLGRSNRRFVANAYEMRDLLLRQ